MVFPQDPPSRVGTTGCLFIPFEGHKALTMLSPQLGHFPSGPGQRHWTWNCWEEKQTERGPEELDRGWGCYQVPHL